MTEIIIPIKPLPIAKGRLAGHLNADERARLVLAMLEDLLTTITGMGHRRIRIVTGDSNVVGVARRFGAACILETRARGYNAAVTLGVCSLSESDDVAIIPGDVPLARPDEIAWLITPPDPARPAIRLVPSRDRLGTNGLFLSGGTRIRPGFGPGSFAGHCRTALALNIEPTIIEAPGMALDIDTISDLLDFRACAGTGATRRFLRDIQPAGGHRHLDRGAA